METSRDNKHEEDIVPRSMFETLCKGVHQEMLCGHRCCWLPLEDEARPAWSSSLSLSVGTSLWDMMRTMNNRMRDTFVMTITMTTYNNKTCTII